MPKGSLREYISDEASGLGWNTRYKIIEGICYGLHYLHEEWQSGTPIIHMDLKPANILLDDNMVPKIADFGLSRLFSEEKTRTCTLNCENCDGTLGYMAPEYINRGLITTKSDIFSLGVILIEIVTGRKDKDYPDEAEVSSQEFIELVLNNWRNRLQETVGYEEELCYRQIRSCIQIGLVCVEFDRWKRPTTSQIIKMLHADLSATKGVTNAVAISSSPEFSLAALRAATGDFAPYKRIGSGGSSTVFRASLADGREVAIERAEHRWSSSSGLPVSKLEQLSRVNHKNLVRLLGFCADGGERILVYEYMLNGALHEHLHMRHSAAPLSPPLVSWPARLRLALGAARGIEHMHAYAGGPPIIHRDIKPPKIFLDAAWNAKVSYLGLWLLNDDDLSSRDDGDEPCMTVGTVGYVDPEYYQLRHLTDKSHVYSFGVVLLELLTGFKVIHRRGRGPRALKDLIEFAVPHIEADRVHRVLDARLPPPTTGEMESVAYVGYLAAECVRPAGRDRPTMSEVVGVLERAVAACEEENDDRGDGEAVLSRSSTDGSSTTT
ncbi:unnamed protein product [Urochloa decumbens]